MLPLSHVAINASGRIGIHSAIAPAALEHSSATLSTSREPES